MCFFHLFLAKKVTRVRWTTDEKMEIQKLFHVNFTKKKCPNQRECEVAITQSKLAGGHIHVRYWETLKKKVLYMIQNQKWSSLLCVGVCELSVSVIIVG